MECWNVAHYWDFSSYRLLSSVHWMLKTYFLDQSRNVLVPNKLNSDTDFPRASQHRKEGALAVTHSHLLHTHNGEIGHGVLLFHMAVGSVFLCLSVTLLAVAASAFTAAAVVWQMLSSGIKWPSSVLMRSFGYLVTSVQWKSRKSLPLVFWF